MHKISLAFLIGAAVVLSGCGSNTSHKKETKLAPIPNVDVKKSIQEGKIKAYNPSDPIEKQYTAVVNYLRSQSITCSDASGFSGPLPSIKWNSKLYMSAKEHSDDYNQTGAYKHDHTGSGEGSDVTAVSLGITPKGSTPRQRVEHQGYDGYAGENQANYISYHANGIPPANFKKIEPTTWMDVMSGWMQSQHGHCSNIMNPDATEFGMAQSGARYDNNGTDDIYTTYWTQDFGGQ